MSDKAAVFGSEAGIFATTLWTVVARAGETGSTAARTALETLCEAYWYPLYAHVRRQGHSRESAEDLTQEFFARLLERKYLRLADRSRGRFRTFLLTSLKHFLNNEWKKENRIKRGGGAQVISLDVEQTETRFLAEAADRRTPDKAFDRRWATVLLERVLDRLEKEKADKGEGALFGELKGALSGEGNESSYAEIAERFSMTRENLKVSVHRLRKRFKELLRDEIRRTIEDPAQVDEEMRDLMAALND
ncbi:MAG TPA: sigma-70 family RNA polymerase sigma factor [Verrucomicrobiae bacterium]|nr:sigma-70 family RNA polymerase sigma factor [Verrucomicrobiae bacterium]